MPTLQVRAIRRAVEIWGLQPLAKRLGVTEAQLSYWLHGLDVPADHIFLVIADLLSEHALEQLRATGRPLAEGSEP